jgi:methionine-rich copper-binding protein CopC
MSGALTAVVRLLRSKNPFCMKKAFRSGTGKPTAAMVGLVILVSWLGTNSVLGHAQLIKSKPSDKAELKQAPTQVELWFNELLDEGFNSIEVIPAAELTAKNHPNLAKGPPKVDPADRTHLTVALSALKPGKYVIQYRVLSRDGHSAPGRVNFQVLEGKK